MTIKGHKFDTRAGFGRWRVTYKISETVPFCQETLDQSMTFSQVERWTTAKRATMPGVIGVIIERDSA